MSKTDGKISPAGLVWLVGGGPGDPGLITVKGLRCITEADCLVYDSLCNPVLLDHARPDAERIYVGKRAGSHAMPQDEINEVLRIKAQEGKRVCRLKGGDPFVFGRGGEEASHLHKHGVPFEVVPGVTSAIAVPAYAGIPVTHREMTTSVRIITGHEDPTKSSSGLDWAEIASSQATLVFLMGVTNLPHIAGRLIENGRSPATPAAVIANGTLPTQRTVVATLETIAKATAKAGLKPPAILVVGEVAALREELNWFETKPLFGRTIVVTRARAQASELAAALENLGAEVISAPVIRTESLADSEPMRKAARESGQADWIVFTSVNGVDAFLDALDKESMDARALAKVRLAAIGPATVERLRARGLRADLMPAKYVAEALLDALIAEAKDVSGLTFLLPRADLARPMLAEGLRERGATVIEVDAYRTDAENDLPVNLVKRLADGQIDLVTFSSSSTVRNFVDALPAERRAELIPLIRAASIGPVTSETLREMGISIDVTASESTIPSLVDAIREAFQKTRS